MSLNTWNVCRKAFQEYRPLYTDIADGVTIGIFIVAAFCLFVEGVQFFSSKFEVVSYLESGLLILLSLVLLNLALIRMYLGATVNNFLHQIFFELKKLKVAMESYKRLHKSYMEGNLTA